MAEKEKVAQMFNKIAKRYDLLNHLLSFGLDYLWRRRLIRLIIKDNPTTLLDVATGTGDILILAKKKHAFKKLVGLDISEGMLQFCEVKSSEKTSK